MPSGDPLLQGLDPWFLELGDRTAGTADQVIVMGGEVAFVSLRAFAEIEFLRVLMTNQPLEGPIDGGGTDSSTIPPYAACQLLHGEVGIGPEEHLDDLRTTPASFAAGCRDLVVDATEEGFHEMDCDLILKMNFILRI